MQVDADRTDEEATAPAECGGDAGLARAGAFQPVAEDGGGEAEEDDAEGEDHDEVAAAPVTVGGDECLNEAQVFADLGCGEADRAFQWLPEDAQPIRHANAEVDRQGGRRDQPAVEARFGDDPLAVEQAGCAWICGWHWFSSPSRPSCEPFTATKVVPWGLCNNQLL